MIEGEHLADPEKILKEEILSADVEKSTCLIQPCTHILKPSMMGANQKEHKKQVLELSLKENPKLKTSF